MMKQRVLKILICLMSLTLTQCKFSEVMASLLIGSSIVETAATIASAVDSASLTKEIDETSNDTSVQPLTILNSSNDECSVLAFSKIPDDGELMVQAFLTNEDGSESILDATARSLSENSDVRFEIILLTDQNIIEGETDYGDVISIAQQSEWLPKMTEVLAADHGSDRPVLIIDAHQSVLETGANLDSILALAQEQNALFFNLGAAQGSEFDVAVTQAQRSLGQISGDSIDDMFAAAADRIDAAMVVSLPVDACDSLDQVQIEFEAASVAETE